jgi:hypothetical protein
VTVATQSSGKHARTGLGAILGTMFVLFVFELVVDIIFLPADIILVPAEAILDALIFAVLFASALVRRGSGRHIRSRSLGVVAALGIVLVLVATATIVPPSSTTGLGKPSDGLSALSGASGTPGYSTWNGAHPAPPAAPHPDAGGSAASWAQVCSATAPFTCLPQPSGRIGAETTWDAADSYTVLFGGGTTHLGGFVNDTWKWNRGAWTQLANGPATLTARTNSSMTYDTIDGYVLMWGGYTAANTYSAQTWKLLAGTWTLLSPASSPVAVIPSCFVYVPFVTGHGGYVLLYGGKGTGTSYQSFTWEYSGGVWTNVTGSVGTAPSARGYAQCAYDVADGYVVMFGGVATGGTTLDSDTWEFNPQSSATGAWVSLSPSTHPEARFFAGLSYVTALSTTYLACGAYGTLNAPTFPGGGCSTWSYAAGVWTNVSATVGFGGIGGQPYPLSQFDFPFSDQPTLSYAFLSTGFIVGSFTKNTSNALGNLLTLTLGETNGETYAGGQITFWANASNGLTPYRYTWSGLPTGCAATNVSVIVCSPSTAGRYPAISVKVTGTDGFNVTSKTASVFVDPTAVTTGNLSIGASVGPSSQTFWGTDFSSFPLTLNHTLAALINQTPFRTLRYGADASAVNATNLTIGPLGCAYFNSNVCAQSTNNYTIFKTFCGWVHCVSILTLPTETNDRGLVAISVRYIEQTLNFHPTYWNLGNEPSSWTHFNKPYNTWAPTDAVTPTPTQYNKLVLNDTAAVLSVDPAARIIGLTQAAPGGSLAPFPASIFNTVAASSGVNLTGLSFHTYAANGETFRVPSAALSWANTVSASANYTNYLTNMRAGCAACPLTLTVSEYNTGVTTFAQTYTSGVAAAANAAQLLNLGVPMFAYYDVYGTALLDMVNASTGYADPAFYVYASVLSSLPMGTTYNASVSSAARGLFAIEEVNGSKAGVLVVNTNTSVGVTLTPTYSFGTDTLAVLTDTPTGVLATVNYAVPPATVFVPPMSVMLLVYAAPPLVKAPVTPAPPATAASGPLLTPGVIVAVVSGGVLLGILVLVLAVFTPRRRSGRQVGR